jgi:hypothetical protein
MIPSIAFSVPDLDGTAKLELKAKNGGQSVACIQSQVGNGKTMSTKAVPLIAAGIAGGAFVVSAISAMGAGGHPGTTTPSPSFTDVMGWFQSMALNGMLSVQYPTVYRSFTKNFGFSGGLIQWEGMERAIDKFRAATGGNLTADSVDYLKNATLIYDTSENGTLSKRGFDALIFTRDLSLGQGAAAGTNATAESKTMHAVHGIQAYAEQLAIPQSNTFMTALLIFAIVCAAIIVGILLFKVILELWAMFGTFPKKLVGFRKRYWWIMAKTITNLILVLYGVWTLYCVYQFTRRDSWAAMVLAGVSLGLFTLVLAWFTWRIWSLARKYKKAEGDASALYDNKETWRKYSLFYENYKKGYWWLFLPTIIYMAARGVVIAAGDGHGMVQTGGQLIIEALMLVLLLWVRPYSLKSGNWINITIQVVRVLSVLCILVFVEQLGIAQTPKTIVGVVLIVMQSVLTGLLAILIAVNALIVFFKANPHRKARKEAGKSTSIWCLDEPQLIPKTEKNRDLDNLTPLDARNSLLLSPHKLKGGADIDVEERRGYTDAPTSQHTRNQSSLSLGAGRNYSSSPPASMRAPLLPNVDLPHQRAY